MDTHSARSDITRERATRVPCSVQQSATAGGPTHTVPRVGGRAGLRAHVPGRTVPECRLRAHARCEAGPVCLPPVTRARSTLRLALRLSVNRTPLPRAPQDRTSPDHRDG